MIIEDLRVIITRIGVDDFAEKCHAALFTHRDKQKEINCANDATARFRKKLQEIYDRESWKYID